LIDDSIYLLFDNPVLMLRLKLILKISMLAIAVLLIFCVASNVWVIRSTEDKVYSSVEDMPANDVGLLLGTSKRYRNGKENMYFRYRIEAASLLYQKGKIRHIIVSGDNRTMYYNEPMDMKKALIKAGVPDSVITLDYAGFRTLDSVVRCKKIFGQDKVTIISQNFHASRALFIGQSHGMNAIGFQAADVKGSNSYKVTFREFLARPKAVIDVYILHEQPRFLGNMEVISVL
jgi:SanA protein